LRINRNTEWHDEVFDMTPKPASAPLPLPGSSGNVVLVEVLVLRLDDSGRLAYRVAHGQAHGREPDTVAIEAGGVRTGLAAVGTVSHSTSWRYDGGQIVLTYAVAPDPQPHLTATPLPHVGIVCSNDPLYPTPAVLHEHHIAAHAVRHLGYLARTDPTVAKAASQQPDLWRALDHYAAAATVGDHDQTHHSTPDRRHRLTRLRGVPRLRRSGGR
jgi:hypothetical protein